MLVVPPEEPTFEEWRPGVGTRLLAAAATGATGLCVMEQWTEPGAGAPTHSHLDVEEVIIVLEGTAEFWVGEERALLTAGSTLVVPPHARHGYRNAGSEPLHLYAVFNSASPPMAYEGDPAGVLELGSAKTGPQRRPRGD